MRFYHVADASYQEGEDLLCWQEQMDRGWAPAWKWEDAPEGFDGDVVCLFERIEDAVEFRGSFAPDGILLAVDLPDDYEAWGMRLTHVDEGYPAIRRRILAEFVSRAEVAA